MDAVLFGDLATVGTEDPEDHRGVAGAKKALAEIWGAEDKDHAFAPVKAFEAAYGAKFPKATAKITGGLDQLLAFYDYPCEHWVHLRTTNSSSGPATMPSPRPPKTS